MMKTLAQNEAFARSAPMVYTVVTSLDEEGKPNALGVSWVVRTSFEPFLMLISIDHEPVFACGDTEKPGVRHQLSRSRPEEWGMDLWDNNGPEQRQDKNLRPLIHQIRKSQTADH